MDESRLFRHRIKNDLQLIASLVRLDVAATNDAVVKKALTAVDRRVLAVTMTYASDERDDVTMPPYLEELARAVPGATLTCDAFELPSGPATRVGLIVTELLGSAESAVTVSVTLPDKDPKKRLRIDAQRDHATPDRDWLCGLPEDIVTSLVRQLRGSFETQTKTHITLHIEP